MADKDPLKVTSRLYSQIGALLGDLEKGDDQSLRERIHKRLADKKATLDSLRTALEKELVAEPGVTMRERIAALVAIGRLMVLFGNLGKQDEPVAGGKISRYAKAFKAKSNVVSSRKGSSGPTVVPFSDPFPDEDESDTDPAA